MATGIYSWSQTAATNSTADSTINWAEGQAPSTVNDSARALMAVNARWRDDISGVKPSNAIMTSSASATAQTLSTNASIAALTNGWTLTFKAGATNTGALTLAVDSLTAKAVQRISGTALAGGEIIAGCVYTVTYHQPADSWVLQQAALDVTQGSWTPVVAFGGASVGVTYSTQVGRYLKIGPLVEAWGRIVLSSNGSSTGTATITGLPYTSTNVTGLIYAGTLIGSTTGGGGSVNSSPSCSVAANATTINLFQMSDNDGASSGTAVLTENEFGDTADWRVRVSYRTDS